MPTDAAEPAVQEMPSAPVRVRRTADHRPPGRFSWWLWPHLLSLDAPLVAVAWQAWWARSASVELPAHAHWILGLGVWMIYLSDRLADTTMGRAEIPSTPRHAFHARWRVALLPLALACAGVLALLTPGWLVREVFLKGLALLACAGVYFWLIHNRRFHAWQLFAPKEVIVGSMFALGTIFFSWCLGGMARPNSVAAASLFAALCACNCALITRWESNAQDLADPVSLLNAFPRTVCYLGLASLALGGAAGGLWLAGGTPVFAPLFFGGILLACLDSFRHRLSIPALRVLADVALLTPLCFLA